MKNTLTATLWLCDTHESLEIEDKHNLKTGGVTATPDSWKSQICSVSGCVDAATHHLYVFIEAHNK